MKISKYLLVAAAGVMMFGCAKDDNKGGLDNEPVAFSVKIVKPEVLSKATGNYTDAAAEGGMILSCENMTITLKNGEETIAIASEVNLANLSDDTYTFWNVEKPTSVEVSINGGKSGYTALTELEMKAESMPAFGMTTDIQYAGLKAYDENLAGQLEGDAEALDSYSNYAATVQVRIPVARLEMGGICHVTTTGQEPLFDNLMFVSVELRSAAVEGEYTEVADDFAFVAGTNVTNLKDEVNSNFLAENAVFPNATECYVYNFFVSAEKQPTVVFNFTTLIGEETVNLYGVVDHFVNAEGKDIGDFEAGKIYQIKKVEIEDGDLTTNPTGEDAISVTVTVEVQDWAIVPMSDVVFI